MSWGTPTLKSSNGARNARTLHERAVVVSHGTASHGPRSGPPRHHARAPGHGAANRRGAGVAAVPGDTRGAQQAARAHPGRVARPPRRPSIGAGVVAKAGMSNSQPQDTQEQH